MTATYRPESDDDQQTGIWKQGNWNWAYRFRLPEDHGQAGEYVYGCGFPTRRIAEERQREAQKRYLMGGKS